ncbi:MAG: hypothetical protein K8F91_20820 [Candidatus Obscuribacterales bacterium]|nr:hypothetical protein [Candidatus Obscuribacterales bacterium]
MNTNRFDPYRNGRRRIIERLSVLEHKIVSCLIFGDEKGTLRLLREHLLWNQRRAFIHLHYRFAEQLSSLHIFQKDCLLGNFDDIELSSFENLARRADMFDSLITIRAERFDDSDNPILFRESFSNIDGLLPAIKRFIKNITSTGVPLLELESLWDGLPDLPTMIEQRRIPSPEILMFCGAVYGYRVSISMN